MRLIAMASVLGLCAIGAAFAQSELAPPSVPTFTPAFESNRDALRRYYPTRALERGVVGIVHLCCRALEDRSLGCALAAEWPARHHFGHAGLLLAQNVRMTQDSYVQLQARPQQTFLLPLRWQTAPVPRELDAVAQRINDRTANVCGPETGRANPENYILIEGLRVRRG